MIKDLPAMQETQESWVRSLDWEHPLEESKVDYSSVLARKFHEQRSLADYGPRGRAV